MVRLTDRPDMTLVVYRGRKTTMQQQQQFSRSCLWRDLLLLTDAFSHTSKLAVSLQLLRLKIYSQPHTEHVHMLDRKT